MKNPFKRKIRFSDVPAELTSSLVYELKDLKEKFCGELSKHELVSFSLVSEHFRVIFKIK